MLGHISRPANPAPIEQQQPGRGGAGDRVTSDRPHQHSSDSKVKPSERDVEPVKAKSESFEARVARAKHLQYQKKHFRTGVDHGEAAVSAKKPKTHDSVGDGVAEAMRTCETSIWYR